MRINIINRNNVEIWLLASRLLSRRTILITTALASRSPVISSILSPVTTSGPLLSLPSILIDMLNKNVTLVYKSCAHSPIRFSINQDYELL